MTQFYTVHMNKKIYVYAMVLRDSGKVYVGSSVGPMNRIAEHVSALRCKRHYNESLQMDWDASDLADWDFRLLEEAPAGERFAREYEWVRVLNAASIGYNKTRIQRAINRDYILELLDARTPYRTIRDLTGASLGTIAFVKRRRVEQSD